MKQNKLFVILSMATLAAIIFGFAWAEQLTFPTYYPAPYGVYKEFTTASKTTLATNSQATDPEAKVGIGTDTPSEKLDVTGNIHATGDVCIDTGCLSDVEDADELEIVIETGQINHGLKIPLPTGYTQDQCKWFVSFRELGNIWFGNCQDVECYAAPDRRVTCRFYRKSLNWINGTANYMIIGIK